MVNREIYMNQISSFIDHELIKVITGIRRCGKTYFLNFIVEELYKRNIKKENIIFINFNEKPYNHVENTRELDLLVENLVKNITGKVYLFFDEIQNVDEWQKSVISFSTLYDCDIYISGSNSKMLSGELSTLLTGRYVQIKMYPFSFNEFLDYKNHTSPVTDDIFEEYLIYGGMPVIPSIKDKNNKKKYLTDLYSSILLNDVVSRHNIRDVGILKRLVEFLIDNIGKPLSLTGILEYLKEKRIKVSRKTIYNYLDYLQEACILKKAIYEDLDGKKIFLINEKYYIVDHGFRQAINGNNLKNISRLIENIVYIELLRRGYDISIGKVEGKEIDFVCRQNDKIIYVQVSYHLDSDEVIEREFGSLLLIKDNFPKYVISMDKFDFSQKGIIHLNLVDFLTYKKGDI